jgi:hypothetical protein
MIKKEIEISVDASKAEAGLDDIATSIQDLNKEVTSFAKKGDKAIDDLSKSAKSAEKNTKTLAEGFKGAGLALKAMGIGLVIEGMQMLKEVFMSNQKVADGFSAVMGTVTSLFTQVVNVVVSVTEKVSKNSKGFEGLTNVIKGLMTIGLTPLKLTFYGVQLAINSIQLAWEESIFGDGDPKTIKELKQKIIDTGLSIKKTGEDAVKAGVKVATNLGKAGKELGQVVEGTVEGVSKINVAATYEQSKANVRLQNSAKIAEAEQARLVEQYDRQAEKLRQIRDEERNTIQDRIKANNDLNNVLNNQEKAMIAQADLQIAAARNTYNQNKTLENQLALTNAITNREGVLAQVEGLRSEQKANDLALSRELIELDKTKLDAATELAINQKLFDAERIKDTVAKLEAEKMAIQEQEKLELERLQKNIDSYKEGTIARAEAEKEYALKKQELDNAIIAKEDEIYNAKYEKELERNEIALNKDKLDFEAKLALLKERDAIIEANTALTEEQKTKLIKENADKRKAIIDEEKERELALFNAKVEFAQQGLNLVMEIAGKGSKIGKAIAITQTIISGIQGVMNAYSTAQKSPITALFPGYPYVQAGLAGAFSAIQLAKIKSTSATGGSAPSVSSAGGGAVAPSFNVVGNSGVNALAQTIGTQTQKPLQAYVVAQNVTTAQSLNRNIIQSATLG